MQKIIKILVAIIILIGLLYMYPKVKKRLNGYYEDRISCTFYGVGEPFKEALNGGKFLNIGPYNYELTFNRINTEKYGVISKAELMGQEVELIQDGWTIPKDYTFEKDKAEYTYRQPIFWKGEFDLKVKDSNAQIKGSMKSTIGDNKILIDQNVSVIKSKADYDYDEYLLDDSKKNCFMVLIGKQNIKFCDDRKSAADDMIKLVEKKYNKKFSQNRKNQIYSNYEK